MSDPRRVPAGEGNSPFPSPLPAGTRLHAAASQGHGEGSRGGMTGGHALPAEPAPAPRS
jgi:hypothetical protein